MKRTFSFFLALCTALLSLSCQSKAANNEAQRTEGPKVLVAYFSATGVTANAAQKLATAIGGQLYEIKPAVPYSAADLDWTDKQSRSSREMAPEGRDFRPALADSTDVAAKYDLIFVGYPIWWNVAPTVVNTWLDQQTLKGKKVVPFATSGGSTIDVSAKTLREQYPEADWLGGRLLNGMSVEDIQSWLEGANFLR